MRTMRHLFSALCVALILAVGAPLFVSDVMAQARPKGATAQCKDGTYSKAQNRQGACSRHGGVQTWFADEKPATAAPTKAPTTSAPATKEHTRDSADGGSKTTAKAPQKSAGEAPENATAKCKDGTYSYAKQHRGACSHHGGVAEWYK